MKLYQFIASCAGIGHIKGGGSIAAALTAFVCYLLPENNLLWALLTVVVFFIGVLVSNKAHTEWGKDSSKVVIDEVLGMMISLLFLPKTLGVTVGCFTLFRFFDILKPLGIRKSEKLPKGWGVMADDLFAGIYANLTILLILCVTS